VATEVLSVLNQWIYRIERSDVARRLAAAMVEAGLARRGTRALLHHARMPPGGLGENPDSSTSRSILAFMLELVS